MRVLHVSPSFFPAVGYGGPIQSTLALCRELQERGHEVRVLTTDTNGPWEVVDTEEARKHDEVPVWRSPRDLPHDISADLVRELAHSIEWAEVVHLTGAYSFPTLPCLLSARLMGKPLVWSLRGALLAKGRRGTRAIKRSWLMIARSLLWARSALHATSSEEADASRILMPDVPSYIVPNGVSIPEWVFRGPRSGPRNVLFLGRIHPIKRLEVLLEACGRLVRSGRPVTLTIAGEGDASYQSSLVALAGKSMPTGTVRWLGLVEGEAKEKVFAGADVLALPSETENFGMVVAEALARGVPVIASRGTPWSELERQRCGFWVESTPEAFAAAIVAASSMDLAEMGVRGRAWMEAEFRWERRAEEMEAVYVALLDGTFRAASREARGGREAR
jgi:glycosyltransferase involved in cell wall biosynthesis